MPCLACPVFVSNVGCDVSVVRSTEARAVAGAVPGWILDGVVSRVKAVAGSWSGWHQRGTFTSLKTEFILTLVPFLPLRTLGTGDLVQQITSPRESFCSHSWN